MADGGWHHHNPVRVVAGSLAADLAAQVPAGARTLLVTSAGFTHRGVSARVAELLPGRELTVFDDVRPNPDLQDLDAATERLRGLGLQCVIGLGGGSALDAAKTLALTLPATETAPLARAFRDGVAPTWAQRLPVVAVPTTAGTGAEVTPFATVWDHAQHRKHSLAGPELFPTMALLDATLTLTLPGQETLYPGLDTVSHALESLWNRNVTPVSRACALQALTLAATALPTLLRDPQDLHQRRQMQAASVLAGLAISQTRTALAHAISYPLTTHHGVPHGLACSFTLPALLRANLPTLARDDAERSVLQSVLAMLDGLALGERVRHYVGSAGLLQLQAEMHTPGRSDNYTGVAPASLAGLLQDSVR